MYLWEEAPGKEDLEPARAPFYFHPLHQFSLTHFCFPSPKFSVTPCFPSLEMLEKAQTVDTSDYQQTKLNQQWGRDFCCCNFTMILLLFLAPETPLTCPTKLSSASSVCCWFSHCAMRAAANHFCKIYQKLPSYIWHILYVFHISEKKTLRWG